VYSSVVEETVTVVVNVIVMENVKVQVSSQRAKPSQLTARAKLFEYHHDCKFQQSSHQNKTHDAPVH